MQKTQRLNRVAVTGVSTITSIGLNVQETFANCVAGNTGIRNMIEDFPDFQKFKCQLGATIAKGFNPNDYKVKLSDGRIFGLTNALVQQMFQDAGLDPYNMPEVNRRKFGVFMASNVEMMNNTIRENLNPSSKARGEFLKMNFMIPASVAMTYGLHGTNSITSYACSAGVVAIGEAYRLVKHGYMDKMICGGADYSVSDFGQMNMDTLSALNQSFNDNPDKAMASFDQTRMGTVLGDGGGLMLLENLEQAEKRGAKIYCELIGFHANCQGMHPLAPEESGTDTFYTLKSSLYEAGVKPSEIDMVNCHASSTIVGDISEARGVRKILNHKRAYNDLEVLIRLEPNEVTEDDLDDTQSQSTVLTALKPNLGHTQLCAGAIESILGLMTFQENIVPSVRNLENPCVSGLNFVMKKPVERKINIMAKTCFGFGSSCSSLIFKRFE